MAAWKRTHLQKRTRWGIGLWFVSCLLSTSGYAVQGGFDGWEDIINRNFVFDPDRKAIRPFQARADPEVRLLIQRYEELIAEGNAASGLRQLQTLIDHYGHSVHQVALDRYVGAAEYARYLLLCQSEEILARYQDMAELLGRDDLEVAAAQRSRAALRQVARRFANAAVGQEALLIMARLAHERGSRELAAMYARRVLDFVRRPDGGSTAGEDERRAEALALLAIAEGRAPSLSDAEAEVSLEVGGEHERLADFLAGTRWTEPTRPVSEWPTYGGEFDHDRRMEDLRHPFDSRLMYDVPVSHVGRIDFGNPWPDFLQPPVQPVRMGELLIVNNSLSVKAYNLYSQSLEWEYAGPMTYELDNYFSTRDYPDEYDEPPFSKGLVTSASVAQGIVLANLQIPEPARQVDRISRIRINDPYPWRGIVALSLDDGSLVWAQRGEVRLDQLTQRGYLHQRRIPGDPMGLLSRLDIPGPPSVVDDMVLALGHFIEGAVNSYLVAINLRTGHLEYSVPLAIGQQELSMFNMPYQEFTTGIPVVKEGTAFCPTNLGLLAAVDIAFGDLRWLSAYDAIAIEAPPNYYKNNPRRVYWYNVPPIATRGSILVTPHDSQRIHKFDARTGKQGWDEGVVVATRFFRQRNSAPSCFLLGLVGERVFIVNDDVVQALDFGSGNLVWEFPLGVREVMGTGGLTDQKIYLPTDRGLLVLDHRTGREIESYDWPEQEASRFGNLAGNVLVFSDLLLTATSERVGVAFDPEQVLQTLREQMRLEGRTFKNLARIGNLYRRKNELPAAAEAFEEALALPAHESIPASEVSRVRLGLCRALRSLSTEELARNRRDRALAALLRAEPYADDLAERLGVTRSLLSDFATDPSEPRAMEWLQRLRERHGSERGVIPEVSSHEVTVGIFVSLELARRYALRGDFGAALEELQRLHVEYPDEPFGDTTSVSVAHQRIEELLAAADPDVRRRFDARALGEMEAAYERGEVDRLGLLLRRFSSASDVSRYAARYCEMLGEEGRDSEVLSAGSKILRQDPREETRTPTLRLMATAADRLRNDSLARALRGTAGDPDAGDVEGPLGAARVEEVGRQEIQNGTTLVGGNDFELGGEPLGEALDGYLLLRDLRILTACSLPEGQTLWSTNLVRGLGASWSPKFFHVSGTLIVQRGQTILAIDLRDGSDLWVKKLDQTIHDLDVGAGLLFHVEEEPTLGSDRPATLQLIATEPRTGVELWRNPVAGPSAYSIRAEDRLVLVVSGPSPRQVEGFDCFSGGRLLSPVAVALSRSGHPAYVPAHRAVVVPVQDPLAGASEKVFSVSHLVAYEIGTEKELWRLDFLPFSNRLDALYRLPNSLLLVGGSSRDPLILHVDAGSGKLLSDPLPLLPMLRNSLTVEGSGQSVRSLLFFDPRASPVQGMMIFCIGADGRVAFETRLPIPSGTVRADPPQRILRKGDAMVLLMQRAAGDSYTDLVTLHAGTGEVLQRESYLRASAMRTELFQTGQHLVLQVGTELHFFRWESP